MNDLLIRPALSEDLEDVAVIMAGSPAWAEFGMDKTRALAMLQDADDDIYIAEFNKEVVGCITLRTNGFGNIGAYILILAVKESYRSQKIGAALVDHAADIARQHIPNLFLVCSMFNARAQKFYEQNGFVQAGLLKDLYVKGHDEILYRKMLDTVSLKSNQ